LSAALMHALIFRDGVFPSMTSLRFGATPQGGIVLLRPDPERPTSIAASRKRHQ
jgi:hypothetical protein